MGRIGGLVLGVALSVGCGSKSGGGDDLAVAGAQDLAGAVDDMAMGATGSDMLVSQCNNLSLAGTPVVAIDYVASGAPTFNGGTIGDGTYFITSGTFYSGAGGLTGTYDTVQGVYRFSGTTVDLFVSSKKYGVISETATYSTNTKNLMLTPTCGNQGASSQEYSTTPSLSIGSITGSLGEVLNFTKQ